MSRPTDAEPRPRNAAAAAEPAAWPIARSIKLPPAVGPRDRPFADVLRSRRSHREIVPTSLREVANFIHWSHKPSETWIAKGTSRSHRMASSGGALHPIELVLITPRGDRAFRVDPAAGRVDLLSIRDRPSLRGFCADVLEILPNCRGHIVVFAADIRKVETCYSNPASIVLRDAGVLLQTLHLCATAFRLSFCPLGILGLEAGKALFGRNDCVTCVGTALVGRDAPEPPTRRLARNRPRGACDPT